MILKEVHKLSEHTFPDSKTKELNYFLIGAAFFTAINTELRINVFIPLGFSGLLNLLFYCRFYKLTLLLFLLQYVVLALYCHFGLGGRLPYPLSLALGISPFPPTLPRLFLLGLVAGSLSFGSAYTVIPSSTSKLFFLARGYSRMSSLIVLLSELSSLLRW